MRSLRTILIATVVALAGVAVVSAQQPVVDVVKSDLVARGVALDGPCGAFEITARVAWRLRTSGAGVLTKPSGNNCRGFAVDIVVYPDGHAFDILSDAGGANGPTWNVIEPVDAGRWRAATDPGDADQPSKPPDPPTPAVDLGPILSRLDALERAVQALDATTQSLDTKAEQTRAVVDSLAPVAGAVEAIGARVSALEGRPIPTACSAYLNLGATRIPIPCRLQ